jgi:hypothetical protein
VLVYPEQTLDARNEVPFTAAHSGKSGALVLSLVGRYGVLNTTIVAIEMVQLVTYLINQLHIGGMPLAFSHQIRFMALNHPQQLFGSLLVASKLLVARYRWLCRFHEQ